MRQRSGVRPWLAGWARIHDFEAHLAAWLQSRPFVRYRLHRSGTIEYYFDHRYCCDERSTLPPSPPPYKAFRGETSGRCKFTECTSLHALSVFVPQNRGHDNHRCIVLSLQKLSHNMARLVMNYVFLRVLYCLDSWNSLLLWR